MELLTKQVAAIVLVALDVPKETVREDVNHEKAF